MVQVLPYVPSFGEKLAPVLAQAGSDVMKGIEQGRARKALAKILNPEGEEAQATQGVSVPGVDPSRNMEIYSLAEKAYGHEQAKILSQGFLEKQKIHEKAAVSREEKAEPVLQEMEQKLETHEQEALRFDRLSQLFTPELESKFPPSFAVGLFTKDGELRPTAASVLSPEAQEAVKLITDNIKGAKDTYGSRVTNFDAAQYLKTLPSLLNSPEGRRRVLRDLSIMNKLNQMHEKGVLDIIEREGGPTKISISQAERRYKRENASAIKELKEEFVNPNKKSFSSLPDAKIYSGRLAIDEETGEKFRSNGTEWVPE